ncbi:RES family NAD+ phosphorylase [uncultured Hymenobacter sp.]|uniref:RES family NAD+ phosphorylase n=1 Tax=uncultured Hymenobacter sp. TaxID=170016 RepID=UPI0035CA0B4B
MQVFRLARANRRYDLSGWGAYLVGGRWNLRGTAVLYTATSRALAAMEVLVHLPSGALPNDMYMLTLDLPDTISREELLISQLPPDWQRLSQPQPTAMLGDAWLRSGQSLALRVPSVVVPQEYNLLLNPAHPEFHQVHLASEPELFSFDERLRKA